MVFVVVLFSGSDVGQSNDTPNESILIIPEYNATLKDMGEIITDNSILYPANASSYIMPENEIVKWYAENTILINDALLWKHNKTPLVFKYISDDDLFNNPPSHDMWQNPDYYLTHGLLGDCEDFSVAFASILEAKGISTKVLGVELTNSNKHWIVEYTYNNVTMYADINKNGVVIWNNHNPTIDHIIINVTMVGGTHNEN